VVPSLIERRHYRTGGGYCKGLTSFDCRAFQEVESTHMSYVVALSPCPNDTFIFHGLLRGRISLPGPVRFELRDIQELNEGMARERFDLCKVSSVAALRHSDTYELCSVGAALGYGVGPLLVARPGAAPLGESSRVLAPGSDTTAYALLRHFFPQAPGGRQVVFSEIMPALVRGDADYGVVIHEGRFVYQELGLQCVADLGALWEERYQVPLPLGCLVAHRRVAREWRFAFESAVRSSIQYSYAHRDEALTTMRAHAQELDDRAIWAHVDLYVNKWSSELGVAGQAAFERLKSAMLF
jgi:1,4-dihydroxy-6-naphthoate synthase